MCRFKESTNGRNRDYGVYLGVRGKRKDERQTLGRRLITEIKWTILTGEKQTWLAEQLGKSYNMVNGYVQNRQQPRLEVLFESANIFRSKTTSIIKT